jgi:DNA-directed RNA polymerase subunit RPC12/RpoP
MKKKGNPKIVFDLQTNAFDFMDKAVEEAKSGDTRAWKYSLLNLVSAIELLMKSVLEKEHWSLLFDDVNKASTHKLKSGDFRSVDFNAAQTRLQEIIGIDMPSEYTKFLKQLYDLRNKITHFKFETTELQIKSLIERGCSIFISLYEKGYGSSADEKIVYRLSESLLEFEHFVNERIKQIEDKIKAYDKPSKHFRICDSCWQETLVIATDKAKCLFCGKEIEIEELAQMSEGPGGPCPHCQSGYLGFVLYNNEEGAFHCVICDFVSEFSYNEVCPRCGETFWNKDKDTMCSSCWVEVMSKD